MRAVFGETYPDPVRVVSIGQPVMDLTAGPDNAMWRELSVEFCGGTHVSSTAKIGSFAVVSEEAVAKGVRRLTAVTGEAAKAAEKTAQDLQARVAFASRQNDDDLAAAINELLQAVEAATIPLSRKAEMRAEIGKLQDRVKSAAKAAGALRTAAAVREARSIAESANNNGDLVIVTTVDAAGDDRQALQAAVKTVCDLCPKSAVMLLA